jgi:hypothetical protein
MGEGSIYDEDVVKKSLYEEHLSALAEKMLEVVDQEISLETMYEIQNLVFQKKILVVMMVAIVEESWLIVAAALVDPSMQCFNGFLERKYG